MDDGRTLDHALRERLDARDTSFAVGVPGVLAEFHWASDDVVEHDDGALGLATGRGGIHIRTDLDGQPAQAVAPAHGETGRDALGHRTGTRAPLVYWLAANRASRYGAGGLAELGADHHALRPRDRVQRLFDLGLALGHVQACVRTGDASLIAVLRRHLGENVLERDHPAMAAIKAGSPHRVFRSVMARIEVYQAIPSRARGERTPEGPHTHVLPALLGRDDPAAGDLPEDARVVLSLYPAS